MPLFTNKKISSTLKNNEQNLFSKAQCDNLFSAILVHDDLYPHAKLPDVIHLDYTQQQLQQCYLICKQLWQQGVNRKVLRGIIDNIANQQTLTKEEQLHYKYVRAKFKHLRFAFICFEQKHHYPFVFHRMTILMGKLQDAIKNQQLSGVKRLTFVLKLLLSRFCFHFMEKEIENFVCCEPESFQQYIYHEIDFLSIHLAKDKVTSKQFHEMRKVISRQVALYDNLKTLYPSTYHNSISEYLSTLNGVMGGMHDTLIAKKFEKSQHYYVDTFELPEDIKNRLVIYVDKFKHSSPFN